MACSSVLDCGGEEDSEEEKEGDDATDNEVVPVGGAKPPEEETLAFPCWNAMLLWLYAAWFMLRLRLPFALPSWLLLRLTEPLFSLPCMATP